MKIARLLLSLLAIPLMFLALPAHASTRWLRADTQHFIIYSTGDQAQLIQFATEVERFDNLLRLLFPPKADPSPQRLTIYAIATANDVRRLMDAKATWIAGFYRTDIEGSFAVINREKPSNKFDISSRTILFHEYAHHFMHRNFTFPYPAWFVEGFAEYVSTATFDNAGIWTLGQPALHRAYGLLEGSKLPIETLLFKDHSGLSNQNKDVFYGRAWLLVHMLNDTPLSQEKLRAYIHAIGRGQTQAEAASAIFGDLKELDRSLDKYLKGKMSYLKASEPISIQSTTNITTLDQPSSELVQLRLERLVGADAKGVRDKLAAFTQANPGFPAGWIELGRAEIALAALGDSSDTKRTAGVTAEGYADRALAIDGDNEDANVLKAEILIDRLRDNGDEVASRWDSARTLIRKANARNHDNPQALLAWYHSYAWQGKKMTGNTRDALNAAFHIAPEVSELRFEYALDLANNGEFEAAIQIMQVLAFDPHGGEAGRTGLAQIEAIRQSKTGNPVSPAYENKPGGS